MQADYSPLDSGMTTGAITLSNFDLQHLRTAGKWARFVAVVSLVFLALAVLFIVVFGATMLSYLPIGTLSGPGAFEGLLMLVVYGVMGALYIYVLIKLYQFGSKAVRGVDSTNYNLISDAVAALKSMFKVIGILTAVVLAFYVFSFLMLMISGVGSVL